MSDLDDKLKEILDHIYADSGFFDEAITDIKQEVLIALGKEFNANPITISRFGSSEKISVQMTKHVEMIISKALGIEYT